MGPGTLDFHVIRFETGDIDLYGSSLVPEPWDPLFDLGMGIASSPLWDMMPEAVIVVRHDPPAIAVIGAFADAEIVRLEALTAQLKFALSTFQYVDFREVCRDCQVLAWRLSELPGYGVGQPWGFTAVPRGGLVVLGALSYAMDLSDTHLTAPFPEDAPLVVVDDCAITGDRFRRFLSTCPHRQVVFAPLYSHPVFRATLLQKEPRVVACVSAYDLTDYSEDTAQGARSYHQTWKARLHGERYWHGLPEYLCFAWNEPDRPFWNPVTGRVEGCWTLLSPHHCMKHSAQKVPVFLQPDARGPLRPSTHTIHGGTPDRVFIGSDVSKECYLLSGSGAAMWTALIQEGSEEKAAEIISGQYSVDRPRVRRDIADLVDTLVSKGLMERT